MREATGRYRKERGGSGVENYANAMYSHMNLQINKREAKVLRNVIIKNMNIIGPYF